ncbi:MAG: transposase, partial [Desulfobacteraceae bacterium]|nr:transposase [Desulfobacteraceae bacterium]
GIEAEGIITDKEKGLVPAVREVFPDTPYQWCQYHYLEKLDAPLEDDLLNYLNEKENYATLGILFEHLVGPPTSVDAKHITENEM